MFLIQLLVTNSVEFIQQKAAPSFDRKDGSTGFQRLTRDPSDYDELSLWALWNIWVSSDSRKRSTSHNEKISSKLSPFLMECFTKVCFMCLTENKLLRYRRSSKDLRSLQERLIWVRQDQHLGYVKNMNASSSGLKQAE